MGAIVAAGLLSHVPSIMLPEEERRRRYTGCDTSFPQALREIYRERIQPASGEYENAIGTGQVMLWFPL